jgi:hypothetical protein
MLFNKVSILDVLPHQERQIKEKVASLASNLILNASEEDLIASIKDEYTLDMPELDESDIHIDYGEEKIDVSQDPMRAFMDRSQPFYIAGTRVTFIVPFSGDANLFDVQPQGFSFSLGGPHAELVGTELHMTFSGPNINSARAKTEFDNELNQIKRNLASLKVSIDRHNSGLEQQVRSQIQQRKSKLLADASLAAAIGYPIKRREGAPTTYAVPVQRRKPKIERPAVSSTQFKPEPVLAMAEYEDILNIIRNMVRVMEQSPKAFEKIGEEDLRTHFLVQLNGQYEGNATGETFNFQGKTDILIKVDGKNVFIAECKFWAGEKQFSDTIDQLLSYLSWRDTKAAVLIFNRNVNFSEVIGKIDEATPNHKNYKRSLGKLDESSFRYIFHQPNDKNRELTLTVLVFDVPIIRNKENQV